VCVRTLSLSLFLSRIVSQWHPVCVAHALKSRTAGGNPEPANTNFTGLAHSSELVGVNNQQLAAAVESEAAQGRFVLTLGGDHSLGVGTVAGMLKVHPNLGVIWVDAHADINTPDTSLSGNIHGMPISFLSKTLYDATQLPGFEWMKAVPALNGNQLVYIGLRDVDQKERALIREMGATAYTMYDIDKYGIGKVMEMALADLGDRPLHCSYDIDACDPAIAPSTGTTVRGGLTFREAHFVAEEIAQTGRLKSFDMVEVNPTLNTDPKDHGATTVQMALALVASALGDTIV
jgi:arginase